MSIRVAIIGAGQMGAEHARVVAEDLPGATLRVVCDTDSDRAKSVADECGAHDVAGDPSSVIARRDVDAVIIVSPDATHAPLTIECLAVGRRVLCEKPLSSRSSECIEVMRAEEATGDRHVMLGFMRRYDQSYVEMRQALLSGKLGRALVMHNIHRNMETPIKDFTGAMAITNSAPHEFDAVRHVLGTDYVSVTAAQPRRSDASVAPVVMTLETSDGQLVTIEVNNNAAYGYDVRAELVGETGTIITNSTSHTRIDSRLTASTRHVADWCGRFREAYVRQGREFLRFVESGEFPDTAAGSWDGYSAAFVAEAAVKALETGQRQPVKMIARPEFYA